MLIQLLEPGMTPLPHEEDKKSIAIGIDLGTTHSVLAFSNNRTPKVLPLLSGKKLLPSIVSYGNNEVYVGGDAPFSVIETITSVKRLIGRRYLPQEIKNQYPFIAITDKSLKLTVGDKEIAPLEVSAEILKVIKKNAEEILGKKVERAVITVPAYFDEAARQETKEAAKLAGLEVLRLINEPTAAALAYGLDKGVEGIYVVYDLGGGTFDVSLLKFTKGVFQVLATGGDTLLGGDDIDHLIQAYFKKGDLSAKEARYLKESLSENETTTITFQEKTYTLTQKELAVLSNPLIKKTMAICNQVLNDAGITIKDIQGVVLVGGSTRLKAVRQAVADFFKTTPLTDINPDEVVALGAALQAEALTYGAETLLLDITPLSLGIETMGGIVEKIIERNTPIPTAMAQEFTTYQDGQTAMKIKVVQGERELAKDCRSLGEFILTGIPPMVAGAAKIRITFTLDVDGLLTVCANELLTGTKQEIEINPAYGLSDEAMIQHLRENMEHGAEDIDQRLTIEAHVEAQQMLTQLKSALEQDSDLLVPKELEELQLAIESLEKTVALSDRNAIKQGMQELETLSYNFAEQRINRSIKRALTGQAIGSIT